MPITPYWYHTNRVLYVELEGELSESEIQESDKNVARILQAVQQEEPRYIHCISDNTKLTGTPPLAKLLDLVTNTEARRAMGKVIRSGWVIDVGVPMRNVSLLKFMLDLVAQKNNIHYRQVNSLVDAIEFLRKMDLTLTDLPVLDRAAMTPAVLKVPDIEAPIEAPAAVMVDFAQPAVIDIAQKDSAS